MYRFTLFVFGLFLTSLVSAAPYLKSSGTGDARALEIAARAFSPETDPSVTVWLVAVSHVGSSNYYARIQELLDSVDLVLFEGVDGDRPEFTNPQASEHQGLQTSMAESMGLVFQLNEIDYSRSHFLNSDLSSAELAAVFSDGRPVVEGPGEDTELNRLFETMAGESVGGQFAGSALQWVKQFPGLRAGLRFVMIETLGNLRGDVSQYAGVPPETKRLLEGLLHARNQVVEDDLAVFLSAPGEARSVAVFYGAAHMEHLEQNLVAAHQLVETETVWLTAFSSNLKRSTLSTIERSMIRWFSAQQVAAIKEMAAGATEPDSED